MAFAEELQLALGPTITLGPELPRGGMSRVFTAFDEALQRKIAVKVLAPELAESLSVERFRREIMLVASLQHPNIVPVLSAGEAEGLPYFVMPFVEGESLRARLIRGPLSVRETISIMRDVARALSVAHEHGIVHRDIKPDNVMLTAGVATVTDFGVAKALAAARKPARRTDPEATLEPSAITSVGTTVGTPAYMAPEQAAGDPTTDHRADLYSLGIVGYEMLCGTPPFRGRFAHQLMAAQLGGTPTPIEKRRNDVPAELSRLIGQCLEKERDRRPKSAASVAKVLENPDLATGVAAAAGASPRRSRQRIRLAWAGLALAVVASLAYVAWPRSPSAESSIRATLLVPTFQSPTPDAPGNGPGAAIAEQIVVAASDVPGIRVAGPPLADSLVGQAGPAAGGGRTLTLRGSLQRTQNRSRLTVWLVDGTGFTIWGRTFDSSETDALRLQDALSGAVLADLLPRLRAELGLP